MAARSDRGTMGRAGIVVAVLAVAMLAPGVAVAGCGDHAITLPSSPTDATGAPSGPPTQPCSGLHCSHGPASAPIPMTVLHHDRDSDTGMLSDALCVTRPIDFDSPAVPDFERPFGCSTRVFHPPR